MWCCLLASEEPENVLRGTTLEVYRLFLKSSRPLGIREIQRALNLSSPSLAVYHISKLEEAGLLRRENGEYAINKVLLDDTVRIRRFLIPRYLFYSIFAILALAVELTLLRPPTVTRLYFFETVVTFICALAFSYETAKTWRKRGL